MNVQLENQTEEHVKIFYRSTSSKDVMKWMYRNRTTLEDELENFKKRESIRKAITVDGMYVGDIWAKSAKGLPVDVLLSCCIFDTAYWNRGVATIALQKFLECLKEQYHIGTAGAFLYAENKGSKKVLEKQQFQHKQTFTENEKEAYFYFKNL